MQCHHTRKYILGTVRQSCRLDWSLSTWTRWINIPLFWWVDSILSLVYQRTLVDDDLSDLSDNDKCSALLQRVNKYSSKWLGTWHVLKQTFFKDFILSISLVFPLVLTRVAQPLLIREIVTYIRNPLRLPAYASYLCVFALCIAAILQAILNQQIFFLNQRIGMRIRNALSSTIYKHLLTINTVALQKTDAAQAINLVANDASKFEELCIYVHILFMGPLEAVVMFGLIWWNIGFPTLFGYVILVLLVPTQLMFSRLFSQYRKGTMACTDKRVQAISELVNGCQIIKMYNWEKAMEQRVREIRQQELSHIFKSSCLRSINVTLSVGSLLLISLATFGGSWLLGKTLFPEDIFSAVAFFAMARVSVASLLPVEIEKLSEARVSAQRIDRFMQLGVLCNKCDKGEKENSDYTIIMEDASFSWKDSPSLSNLNLKIKQCTLVGIKGAIGAGKSTLLAAILGEINLVSGKLQRYTSSISYAPQSAWIFADTIRAHILLGKLMDEQRYKSVIKACCLDIDLQNFGEVGDLLMIGDKGINLSGGQKARISLARALYANADLYLLDDPLAAVDPKVAKKVFDECIGPYSLLRGKSRILVTHQTHFLVGADQTILLANGHVEEIHVEEPIANEPSKDTLEADSSDDKETEWTLKSSKVDMNQIFVNETSVDGAIKWSVWFQLFTSPPFRWFGFLLMILLMCAAEALYDYTNLWLAVWSGKSSGEQKSSFYAYVYLGLTLGTLAMIVVRTGFVFLIMLNGSTYFHNRMLSSILYTSLRFVESNPSGRILNRASKDQQVLDESLPLALIDATQSLLMTLGSIIIIGRTNPWVLLVLIPLIPAVLWLRRFYIRSSRQLKRLESVTRSPIYDLFSSSLDGLTSIRAFNVQADFLEMFMKRIDTNLRSYFMLVAAARWFGLRLDLMTSLLTLVTAILAVALRDKTDPSTAALSLSYCITLTGLFQWGIRQSAEAENHMTSAERIYEYGQLPPESHRNSNGSDLIIQPPDD